MLKRFSGRSGAWDPVGASESLPLGIPTDHDLVDFFPLETCQTPEVLKSLQFVSFCWCKAVFFLTAKLHTHEFDEVMIEEFLKDWKGC